MIRNKVYPVDEVLQHTLFISKNNKFNKEGEKHLTGKECKVNFDGELINMASDRYKIFSANKKCVCCGLEGSIMAMEKTEGDVSYHFNMYGFDSEGKEVLFTKDHIIPKSKCGKNHISNYQTMCIKCNEAKSDKL
jgi:hypothetical protein